MREDVRERLHKPCTEPTCRGLGLDPLGIHMVFEEIAYDSVGSAFSSRVMFFRFLSTRS
jgi:hypothetical protein